MRLDIIYARLARWAAVKLGKAGAFVAACMVIFVWLITGPVFRYSDTWQLIINTGTTIITFLMVFLMQNTQNRDTEELKAEMDEVLRRLERLSLRAPSARPR